MILTESIIFTKKKILIYVFVHIFEYIGVIKNKRLSLPKMLLNVCL